VVTTHHSTHHCNAKKYSVLSTLCICTFHMILAVNADYFPQQNQLNILCNGHEVVRVVIRCAFSYRCTLHISVQHGSSTQATIVNCVYTRTTIFSQLLRQLCTLIIVIFPWGSRELSHNNRCCPFP
jgi:hypothetical protein